MQFMVQRFPGAVSIHQPLPQSESSSQGQNRSVSNSKARNQILTSGSIGVINTVILLTKRDVPETSAAEPSVVYGRGTMPVQERPVPPVPQKVPLRVDYVLVTINYNEFSGAKAVFGLTERSIEEGLEYHWGRIVGEGGRFSRIVALVSLKDRHGRLVGQEAARLITDILAPSYLLLIGTAGGVSQRTEVTLGDVVIPEVLHTGTAREEHLRHQPVWHPSAGLWSTARGIVEDDNDLWRDYIAKASRKKLPAKYRPSAIVDGELASTDENFLGVSNPFFRGILQDCPRLMAVEMEAGGIGQFLHAAAAERGAGELPEYLVIKGISDVVYDERDHKNSHKTAKTFIERIGKSSKQAKAHEHLLQGQRKEDVVRTLALALSRGNESDEGDEVQRQRRLWSPRASFAAAAFAKRLVEKHEPRTTTPTPYVRTLSSDTRKLLHTFEGMTRMLVRIYPEMYSDIAEEVLGRLAPHVDQKLHFFTVCPFTPSRYYNLIRDRCPGKESKGGTVPSAEKLREWALEKFPHFNSFAEYAENHQDNCIRILIIEDRASWPDELEDLSHWNFFMEMNQDVPCSVIGRDKLPRSTFLTDYVILGEEILLHYYDEALLLNVGDVKHISTDGYFMRLLWDFQRKNGGAPYESLKAFDRLTRDLMAERDKK